MPALEEMDLHQFAVLWRILTGRDAYNDDGEVQTGEPEEICVRWEEGELDALKPDGTPVRLSGKVTTYETLNIGDQLWLAPNEDTGALDQYYAEGSAGEDVGIMMVERLIGRARSLCGKFTRREYALSKYASTPS